MCDKEINRNSKCIDGLVEKLGINARYKMMKGAECGGDHYLAVAPGIKYVWKKRKKQNK